MRIVHGAKLTAILFAALLFAGIAMSNATPGAHSIEEAKEALNEKVGESVHEEHRVHEPASRKRKPKVGNMGMRQSWSQCIGMDVDEAIEMIKTERPDLKSVVKVYEGSMVTMDMRMDRVRVFCNKEGVVVRPPRVG